jgi:hypothetical protein
MAPDVMTTNAIPLDPVCLSYSGLATPEREGLLYLSPLRMIADIARAAGHG